MGILLLDARCPTPAPLVQSLAALGWIEGRTIAFDCVSAVDQIPQLPALAAQLVARRPDVVASGYLPGVNALKAASSTIPIVMLNVADPVRYGLVETLSRPGGNVTGLASALGELDGKRIELLTEVVPQLARLAVVARPSFEASGAAYYQVVDRTTAAAAKRYGFSYDWFYVERGEDLPQLFEQIAAKGFGAVYPVPSSFSKLNAAHFARSSLATKLPLIGYSISDVEAGMLMSYGPSAENLVRQAAIYIDKILKGAKPAELPVEQPTGFDLALNLATANGMGVTIPPSILLQATRTIE